MFGISTDSVYAHKVFTEVSPSAGKINFPLVSDRNQKISRAYRVLNEETGAAYRAVVIINPEGEIAARLLYPMKVGRNSMELLRLIDALQYSAKTGEGTPANWMPGQQGIMSNIENAGRY